MLEESKEKVELKEDLIEKEKKIKKKKFLKKTALAAMLLPVLGVSLFQSSYMAINNQAKKIVSNEELEHAKYIFSKKFSTDYYIDQFNQGNYTVQQYLQDLNTYKEYEMSLRDFYKNKISTDKKFLSLFPDLKNEIDFMDMLASNNYNNSYLSYMSFDFFYEYKNANSKEKADIYKNLFESEIYQMIRFNYSQGNLSAEQKEFIESKLMQPEEYFKNKTSMDIIDRNLSPMSISSLVKVDGIYSKDIVKLYGISSFQTDFKYVREILFNYVNDNINYKNSNIENERERLIEKLKSDPDIYFNDLNKDQQKRYVEILNIAFDLNQKYHKNKDVLSHKEYDVWNKMSTININLLKNKDPEMFKNTLRLIRYENNISNIRNDFKVKNNEMINYGSLNFNTLNILNKINYIASFSFLNEDDHLDNVSTFGSGNLYDNNSDDSLRLQLSGFYNEKKVYFKDKGCNVKDTINFSFLKNYVYEK